MCFSAAASFAAAAVTGAIGVLCLTRVKRARELPMAATPLIFALQQAVEGPLWLNLPLPGGGVAATSLSYAYLFFAYAFWPVFAPIAVMAAERDGRRRRFMLIWLAVGAGVAAHLGLQLLAQPPGALIVDNHIVYVAGPGGSTAVAVAYLAATTLPLLMSSHRTVVGLGAIILLGSLIAYVFYVEALVSVWCFFAAAASGVILFHIEAGRRRDLSFASA